jgi:tetratricopeptide (TPR) repeat protein
LFELDYLYKRTNKKPADRLSFLKQHEQLVNSRDDLFIEFVTLHNLLGLHKEAAELLAGRNFHPWEGGEGKASGQHVTTYVELAKKAIADKKYKEAIQLLKAAEQYPENLGEGKLHGARENDIHFWMGCACDELNEKSYATVYFELAASGDSNPAPAIFYNDQSPDKIAYQAFAWMRLNQHSEAEECLTNLIAYAKEHMDDEIKIDYFAVSLPDLMIFDDDLNKRNRIHCLYMEGLGYLGLQQVQKAKACFEKLLAFDASHQGALLHLQLLTSELFFSLLKKNIFAKVDNIHS